MSIRNVLRYSIIALIVLGVACDQEPASTDIKSLIGGIRYEQLIAINDGPRVLSHGNSLGIGGREIIIPGDVLWCKVRGSYIVGKKTGTMRPAKWMDSRWEWEGYFILEPAAIDHEAGSDEQRYGKAIAWFEDKNEFDKAVGALPAP